MKLLTDYRHSLHAGKTHRTAFVGPKTNNRARKRWQIRIMVDLPYAIDATERPVETITIDTPVMTYLHAVKFARAKLASALIEHDDHVDFAYQVWMP